MFLIDNPWLCRPHHSNAVLSVLLNRLFHRKRSSIRFVIFFYANPSAPSRHRINRLGIRQIHDIRFNRPLTDSELERKIAQRFFLPPAQRQNYGSSAFIRRHRFSLLFSFYTCILNSKVEVFLPLIKFSLTKNPRRRVYSPSGKKVKKPNIANSTYFLVGALLLLGLFLFRIIARNSKFVHAHVLFYPRRVYSHDTIYNPYN